MSSSRDTSLPLQKFEAKHFYETIEDSSYLNDKKFHQRARPTSRGALLIADYYKSKYDCHISLFIPRTFYDIYTLVLKDFIIEFPTILTELREKAKESKEFRQAILINYGKVHTIPLIYIKDKKHEVLLYANSLYTCENQISDLEQLHHKIKLPIYYISKPRQKDGNSCRNDALIIARDATAKRDGCFIMPDLATFFESHSVRIKGKSGVHSLQSLPPHFLKSAQDSTFFDSYNSKEINKIPVHKKETITLFKKRYTYKKTGVHDPYGNTKIKDVSSYVIEKGLKNRNIIKIQFYASQLPPKFKNEFIVKAKKLLKDNIGLADAIQTRILHEHAEIFYKKSAEDNGLFMKLFDYLTSGPDVNHTASLTKEETRKLRRTIF